MTVYALDIWDDNRKTPVIPGVALSSTGAMFESNSPIPIPDVNETLEVQGSKWKVVRRLFSYVYAIDEKNKTYEPAVKVDVFCSKV